ncbi:MAG: Capsular exopolysaccharide family [Cryobacterium sp.]|nr:Capsular exopolysaccharide family [Cryobacterium sp.]
MELKKLIRILRRSWILITSFALVGLLGGATASLMMPVQYAGETQLFVTIAIAPGSTSGDLVQGNNFAAQKVASYVAVVTSPRVLNPVIKDLNLDTDATELARDVTAEVEPLSVIIVISALASTPEASAELSAAVATSFSDVVVNEIEKPIDGSPSPVKVEVLKEATPPELPALPIVPLNLALGLVIGLFVGAAVAVIAGFADRRVHSRADLEQLTDRPILGGIRFVPHAKRRPLIVQENARSARAEAFRTLRTNLRYVGMDGQTRSLVVTSAVPGEGKTSTAGNLAIVLAEGGASVLLLDADLRVPRVAQYMGLEGAVGLTDLLVGRAPLSDVVQPWGPRGKLHVIPAGHIPPNPSDLLGSKQMAQLLAELVLEYDHVIVDAPPVLPVTDAAVLSRLTSGTLLVVGAGRVKDSEVLAALEALETVGTVPLGLVVTMLPTRGPDANAYAGHRNYAMKEDTVELAADDTIVDPVGAERSGLSAAVGSSAVADGGVPDGRAGAGNGRDVDSDSDRDIDGAVSANRPRR